MLILGGSATSDAADICPAAVVAAGGRLIRFGMPVDPGNLLFLGEQAGRPVVGLPGCARSPALNGADWVLERLAAGIEVTGADIAAMGVGGLLKEIPLRPQPRAGGAAGAGGAAAGGGDAAGGGGGARMRGADKLLEPVADGRPILRAAAEAALASQADARGRGAAAGRRRRGGRRWPGPGSRSSRRPTRPRGWRRRCGRGWRRWPIGRTRWWCCWPTCRRWGPGRSTG